MNKILLVYEDYADLMDVEGALKKVGFDVVGLTSEYAVTEQVLAFNPDLVVGCGRGGKVSSLGVGKRLKDMNRWSGKAILIFAAGVKPQPDDLIRIRVDMVLEAPVPSRRLIQVIGKLLNHDESVLLERLNKAVAVESGAASGAKFSLEAESIYVQGSVGEGKKDDMGLSLRSERVDEEGQGFALNSDEQTEKKKMSFRFGDRSSDEHVVVGKSTTDEGESEVAFEDVNLGDLEKELLGTVAESLPVEEPKAELADLQEKAQKQLRESAEKLRSRMDKYAALVADVKVSPKSTVTRKEAKRRQAQISAEWDKGNLKELDKLRQEFTKALFKK